MRVGFWTWLGMKLAVGGGTPVPSPQQRNPQTAPVPSPRSILAQPVPMPALMPAPGVTAQPGVPISSPAVRDSDRMLADGSGVPVAVTGAATLRERFDAAPVFGAPVAPAGALGVWTGSDLFSVFRRLSARPTVGYEPKGDPS